MRRAIVIIAVYLAVRELVPLATAPVAGLWPEASYGTAFYWAWVVILVMAALAWAGARVPFVPKLHDLSWRDMAWLAGAFVINEWFYGWRVVRLIGGNAQFCQPRWLASSILFAPLVEEWLFRGVLWDAVAAPLAGRLRVIVPCIVTATLFAVWHWPSLFQPSWTGDSGTALIVHFEYGIFLGLLRWRFRCVGIGMVLHAIGNGWSSYTMIP